MDEWIGGVAAVLEGWMMGQAGGVAIADVLFGKINPCGKLAETFPKRLEDTPAFTNWPGDAGEVHYGEGLFMVTAIMTTERFPYYSPSVMD
jgi:beta-glucosidase